jgi:DNA-directed RNA polymerase subunit M/transcription elongation factor TFIIS
MPLMITCPGCKAKLRIRDEFAGKAMKCPRCSSPVDVPAEKEAPAEEVVTAAVVEEEEIVTAEVEPDRPARRKGREPDLVKCPECGKRVPADAKRCRHCRAWLDDRGDEEPGGEWIPCPQCGEPEPRKVEWTWWGSYFGPRLGSQVECVECGHNYNGISGGSNIGLKIVFVALPLLGILGILVGLFFILKGKGVFD